MQRIRLGDQLDKAERKLKKLDEDVSKALLKLATDPRQAYVTVGHGEMYWKKSGDVLPARTIEGMKSGSSSTSRSLSSVRHRGSPRRFRRMPSWSS